MLAVSETALLAGGRHPLHDEIAALAAAVASPENREQIRLARDALLAKSNEHVLLDTAGIIGFFATITTVVDFAGHYSDNILKKTELMADVINGGRKVRETLKSLLCFDGVK